jgi:CDP-diacylglycerol--glycerol-3-phosphate 3-phosphatidyltransferase
MKNVPNILCLIRIALIPFILVFLIPNALTAPMALHLKLLIAGIIFGVAMLTDLFDGMIARKYDAVTNFGKFIDPIADKLLVICVMMAFVDMELISSIPVIIILAREFLVTGLRLAAAGKNVVVAANIWGKAKTMTQGISLGISFAVLWIAALISPEITVANADLTSVPAILSWLCAAVTAVSAISYYMQCKEYIK